MQLPLSQCLSVGLHSEKDILHRVQCILLFSSSWNKMWSDLSIIVLIVSCGIGAFLSVTACLFLLGKAHIIDTNRF